MIILVFITLIFFCPSSYAISKLDKYSEEKRSLEQTEKFSRKVMSKLYQVNNRMKNMSKRRDRTTNRLMDAQSKAKSLAKEQAHLESSIEGQRFRLSKRLKTLYKIGENQLMRLVFSATSSQDLYQNLKYMRALTENDYKLIKNFQENLSQLKITKSRLQKEVKQLLSMQSLLAQQENRLETEQRNKKLILEQLDLEKKEIQASLSSIRKSVDGDEYDLFNFSFFENKGNLPSPVVSGQLKKAFGVTEHPKYKYRLAHKGHRYSGSGVVRNVFAGKVAYVGDVFGYGTTIIISHGDNYYSVYANVKNSVIEAGQKLKKTQPLAEFEDEFYFEIRHFSDAINPQPWLSKEVKHDT